jgi:microcompartment protein CcmL/EutN
MPEDSLKRKISDLALIYEKYESFLQERGYIDESKYLSLSPARIRADESLKEYNVFFLCYTSFTAQAAQTIRAAMETAKRVGGTSTIDSLTVANVHPAVFPAMAQSVVLGPETVGALGVVETFSAVSAVVAADVAAKAADVTLFRLSLAMAMGGKGLLLMTGSLANVQAAVDAAVEGIKERGLLASAVVLPRPEKELFSDYL